MHLFFWNIHRNTCSSMGSRSKASTIVMKRIHHNVLACIRLLNNVLMLWRYYTLICRAVWCLQLFVPSQAKPRSRLPWTLNRVFRFHWIVFWEKLAWHRLTIKHRECWTDAMYPIWCYFSLAWKSKKVHVHSTYFDYLSLQSTCSMMASKVSADFLLGKRSDFSDLKSKKR